MRIKPHSKVRLIFLVHKEFCLYDIIEKEGLIFLLPHMLSVGYVVMNFIKICVVYINVSMFRAFFDLNPCLWPYDVKGVDNRLKNFGLPKIYNELIEDFLK